MFHLGKGRLGSDTLLQGWLVPKALFEVLLGMETETVLLQTASLVASKTQFHFFRLCGSVPLQCFKRPREL